VDNLCGLFLSLELEQIGHSTGILIFNNFVLILSILKWPNLRCHKSSFSEGLSVIEFNSLVVLKLFVFKLITFVDTQILKLLEEFEVTCVILFP